MSVAPEPPPVTAGPPPEVVGALVDRVMALGGRLQGLVAEVAGHHGLTGQQASLLRSLDAPRPMRSVADRLKCDPSNVTGLIDRIEARGLVERTADPADRRVRLLALTDRGRRVRDAVDAELVVQVTQATRLGADEARSLVALLARIELGEPGPTCA